MRMAQIFVKYLLKENWSKIFCEAKLNYLFLRPDPVVEMEPKKFVFAEFVFLYIDFVKMPANWECI